MSFTFQNTPDKVYYDVAISNIANSDTPPPALYFNETRNNPFVTDPESYYLSIIRFTLDTPTLPILTPEIQPNQSDRNLTIYSVSLEWTNPIAPFQKFTQQSFVTYLPQNTSISPPAPPSQTDNGLKNNSQTYYDIYNYQYWIYLVNNTFTTCFNALNAQVVAAGLVLPTTYAPVMSWDTQQNIAILNADVLGYNDTAANYIKIYFNPSMYNLFCSFPVVIEGFATIVDGTNIRLIMSGFGGSNIVPFPPVAPVYTALQIVQEYSTISLWTPVTSIVFTSNTLPIVPNNLSAPLLFLNGVRYTSGGNNSNIAQVITDFVANDGLYKPSITFAPSAQYRLINLVGNTPLYNLDVAVFYKNRIGELIPLRLGSGGTATIKILFTRKGTEGTTKP
jgi:hypothetical protein